jgi:outer membrane protein insertion porin family
VTKSEADKIREKIGLERDKVITDNLKTSTTNAVRKFYIDKGYLDADVKLVEIKDTVFANKNILDIVVDKKKIYRIYEIRFEGNNNVSDLSLRKSMKDTKQKKWYKIFTSGKFMEDEYEADKLKVIALYNDKGFRDARIVSDSVLRTSKQTLRIHIRVDEGPKYYFRNITWVGNSKHTSTELSGVLNIKKGDVYNQSVLEERLYMSQNGHDVTSIYMDDGLPVLLRHACGSQRRERFHRP